MPLRPLGLGVIHHIRFNPSNAQVHIFTFFKQLPHHFLQHTS